MQFHIRDAVHCGGNHEPTPGSRYVVTSWMLAYEGLDPAREALREALCALGNGYFCTRGSAPEASADGVHYPGTYLAGVYNRLNTEIAGRVVENEDLVNLPNWLCLSFRAEDGEWLDLSDEGVFDFRQELDLKRGMLLRSFRVRDERGRETSVRERRFVCRTRRHLAGLELTITPKNWSGALTVRSALDGRVTNSGTKRYRALNGQHLESVECGGVAGGGVYLVTRTNQSLVRIAEAARTTLMENAEPLDAKRHRIEEDGYVAEEIDVAVKRGRPLLVEKLISLYCSRDPAIPECAQAAREAVRRVGSFDDLLHDHEKTWARVWHRFDVRLQASEHIQSVLRLHIFHMLQTLSPNTIDLDAGVPARGLHGEAYRGHIFWDELFVLPCVTLRMPDVTRALLLYRYRRLNEARWSARQAGYRGAMFPWQSSSDGREESQQLHLNPVSGRWVPDNSHLQRHVGAAIAYNAWHYVQATDDLDFLFFYGAEMMLEIARFFASASRYDPSRKRYDIAGVMGPDEYHDAYPGAAEPGLKNNAYTNLMAVWVLKRALEALDRLDEERRATLCERLDLSKEEIAAWDDISRRLTVVFHDGGIISQFEGYDDLKEFDWEGYRQRYQDISRLDRILEAEGDTTNRYKLSKQADVLMLFYLFSSEELAELFEHLGYPFDPASIPRTIDYYQKRTCHGSTLSRIVHSWVIARSDREGSWRLFEEALESDISDVQGGTTAEGIHLGAMAGTVDLVQRCYTGLELRGDELRFNSCLPKELGGIDQRIRYRGHWLEISVTKDRLRVSAEKGPAQTFRLKTNHKTVSLGQGQSVEVPI